MPEGPLRIVGAPGFSDPIIGPKYGYFKDKSFDAKLLVLPEGSWWPAIAAGGHDIGGGTGVFRAYYGVASKKLDTLDLTLGYGGERIDGVFGGARWTPRGLRDWSLVAEYDAFDYKRDQGSAESGAGQYRKGAAAGIEYRQSWWGVKAFTAHGHAGVNAYVSLPLQEREFAPKIDEPPPYTRINPRPTEEQWRDDPEHRARLGRALQAQDFRGISLGYAHGRLEAALTNRRISSMPRAVGRAARTLLSFAPLEVRELRVTYLQGTLPLATYTFTDARLLLRYFNGMASREQLAPSVEIQYAEPARANAEQDTKEALQAFAEPLPQALVLGPKDADLIALDSENLAGGRLRVRPGLAVYFNDPSGAFRYDIAAVGEYARPIAHRTFFEAQTWLSLVEDISDVTTPSNSELPHVRTDVAEYKRGSRFKLTRLLVNRFFHPGSRVYTRASAGIYEEMFGGFGGQVLYLGRDGGWAFDLSSDWVKQRDFEGWFGFRDYSTLTTIASLNYRLWAGLTATLRAGRFLARDEGVRFELKRRFASGWEIGGWYTRTNGHDITSPGSPSNPYHDKGIIVRMALDTMFTKDNQAVAGFALAPWTRDVGQMVDSPGDLYRHFERRVVQMHARDGLERFGDREDDR